MGDKDKNKDKTVKMDDEVNVNDEEEEEEEDEPEPKGKCKPKEQVNTIARTRSRRSNAGARMPFMILAEEDDFYASMYGGFDDEEDDTDFEGDEDAKEDGGEGASSDSGSSESNSDDGSDDSSCDESEQAQSNLKIKKELQEAVPLLKDIPDTKPNLDHKPIIYPKICSVCLAKQSDEEDEIIECDSCGVPVHESCYGVNEESQDSPNKSPSNHSQISTESTEPWFCEPCRRSVRNPICELCPNLGGIFKETDTGRWVHMVCALYTTGVTFEDVTNLKSVSLFEINYQLWGSKTCTICEDRRLARSGLCIECDAGMCKTFFHVTCAQREGLLFESPNEIDPYFAQCRQHADKEIIKKKKKTFLALHHRLKSLQSDDLYNSNERIRQKLAEFTSQASPAFSRWTESNKPPIPQKVSRSLLTCPSVILKLTKKTELAGVDPQSSFALIQDEVEMARQKWHVPPAFDLEFVAYTRDRNSRMISMRKQNLDLISQNETLKNKESSLRERYEYLNAVFNQIKQEIDAKVKQARIWQEKVSSHTGKPCHFPSALEKIISKALNTTKKQNSETKDIKCTTQECDKCKNVKDQHLLSLCDTCKMYFHIYCLDPPLKRVPKKTKFGGWECSDCSEAREEAEQDEGT